MKRKKQGGNSFAIFASNKYLKSHTTGQKCRTTVSHMRNRWEENSMLEYNRASAFRVYGRGKDEILEAKTGLEKARVG